MCRTIIIGDIHGCYDELMDLLGVVNPREDERIIAIGDLVDRGPDSERVLRFFRDTPNAMSIMGNHERKHLLSARGKTRPALSQRIVAAQLGDRYDEWLVFMESMPLHLELPEAILVHGMFEPGVELQEQRDTVLIGTMTGERYMEQNYPSPWYEHHTGAQPLVVGHHHYLRNGEPLVRQGLLYAIDTGCVHGYRLTALVLPEFAVVSVPARGDHWSRIRCEYAVMAGSAASELDLDWETLHAYAKSAEVDRLPAQHRDRAERCARIIRECDRLAASVRDQVNDQCAEFLAALAAADDWKALAPRKQAARFARGVQGEAHAALLFAARKERLDDECVFKLARTARGMLRMAQGLHLSTGLPDFE